MPEGLRRKPHTPVLKAEKRNRGWAVSVYGLAKHVIAPHLVDNQDVPACDRYRHIISNLAVESLKGSSLETLSPVAKQAIM